MKKFMIIFVLFLLITLPAVSALSQDNDAHEIVTAIKLIKGNAVGIFDVGFKVWVRSNWWIFILAIVGVGHCIVKVTPTKKDDKFFGRFVVKPLRFIAKIMDLDLIFDFLKKER